MSDVQATPQPATLTSKVERLRVERARLASFKGKLAILTATFDRETAELRRAAEDAAEVARRLEGEIRELAVASFETTGDTTPAPGISVALNTVVDYNRDEALEWARTALPSAVVPESLDVKAFDKIARTGALPFVTLHKVPTVKIATDLTKALNAPGGA